MTTIEKNTLDAAPQKSSPEPAPKARTESRKEISRETAEDRAYKILSEPQTPLEKLAATSDILGDVARNRTAERRYDGKPNESLNTTRTPAGQEMSAPEKGQINDLYRSLIKEAESRDAIPEETTGNRVRFEASKIVAKERGAFLKQENPQIYGQVLELNKKAKEIKALLERGKQLSPEHRERLESFYSSTVRRAVDLFNQGFSEAVTRKNAMQKLEAVRGQLSKETLKTRVAEAMERERAKLLEIKQKKQEDKQGTKHGRDPGAPKLGLFNRLANWWQGKK